MALTVFSLLLTLHLMSQTSATTAPPVTTSEPGNGQWLERDSSWVVDSSGVWVDDKGRAYDAAKALDGEKGTYWNAQPKGQGQYNYNNWYFVLDLITSHTLTRIAVKNYGDTTHDIAAFTLQKSQAGSPYSWVDVVSVDNVTGGTRQRQEFGGFQGTARYWRFVVTRTHSGWQPWLPELNFYGILRVVGPDFKAASCSEMKSSFPASKDGEYTLHPFSTCEDVSLRVYCHNMASEQPEEFLTLPSGPENNFANIFADRLYNGGQCDGQLQGPYARRAGTTKFSKIRIKFENSMVKVIRDDYTFASTVGYNNVSYGEAGDCYSRKQGCAKGTFMLNLTGTDLSLASDVHWVMEERYPDYLRINDMFISEERTVASARCGGWCGHCWPVGKTLFLSHPQCDTSSQNNYCIEESVDTEVGQVTFPRTDGGSFNYSAERCNSSEGNEKPLATRFCRIKPDSTAVWDQPVVLRCDTDLQNLSQIVVNNETALSVATELQVITTQAETLSSGDVNTITAILQKIVNASATEQIGESILTIADNFMKVNETVLLDSHQTDRAPTRVLQALEIFADRVDLSTDRFTSKRQDVALQAADVSVQEFDQGQGLALFLNENSSNSLSEGRLSSFTKEDVREGFLQTADIDVSIRLPANLSSVLPLNNTTEVRVSYILYNDDSLFVQPSQDAVRTRIISGRIAGMQVKNLPEPVVITFAPTKEVSDEEGKVVRCVFWDFEAEAGQGAWSSDGCMSQGKANGRYTCTCDHLTNFAVLFDVHDSGFGDHERPLQTISYVGSIVSIIALVLTLLSFTITGKQRQSARGPHARNQRLVLINLCVALLAILITFLAGIDQTASPIVCTAVAALLHYFLLAALMWMAVEAVMIYLAAVMVFGHYVSESFVYKAAVVAWGFPFIVMMSTVGPSGLYEYKNSDYCWLAHLPMTYAFLLPAGLILLFNMIIFSIVMYKLAKREKVQKTLTGIKMEDVDNQWILGQLRRAFSIMSLFGLTWVFGFFVISGGQPAFAYLFCIFNTLQGLFVFIFHCVLREDMRKWLKKFDFKGKKKNTYVLDENKPSSAAAELMQFKRVQPDNSPDGSFEEVTE